ncbi:MAG: acetyl-CoA carboxylase biotin carboxyl carrier protein [Allosphingosinicella sp.]
MSKEKDSEGAMRADTDLIRQLADLLTEKDLSEIEVEDSDRRVVVKRQVSVAAPAPAFAAAVAPAAASAPAAAAAPVTEESAASHPGAVKSPMVGTVYLSPEPGSGPFVAPGMKVGAGDTLLIIEAMKVMNPITAPRGGTVKQVLVQDAQPVEFDQPLVIIE